MNIISKGIRRFIKAKKYWRQLPKVEIAIFDTFTGSYLIKLLHEYKCFAIDLRGESYHIPTLICAALYWIFNFGKVSISILYFEMLIIRLSPKICITHQDSHRLFYQLDKRLKCIRFIAIQQGLKNIYTLDVFSKISGDYFAYGIAYANKLSNGLATMYVTGSIKSNMIELGFKKNRVCIISNLTCEDDDLKLNAFKNVKFSEFIYPAVYSLTQEVDKFCNNNKIELVIAPKANRNDNYEDHHPLFSREYILYQNILHRKPTIIQGDSYEIAGNSEMIVTDSSALGYELLGRGCKVVFLNMTCHYHSERSFGFGWPLDLPDQGFFWTNKYDQEYIQNMLLRVLGASDLDWKKEIAPIQQMLMHYDKNNLILLSHIDKVINSR